MKKFLLNIIALTYLVGAMFCAYLPDGMLAVVGFTICVAASCGCMVLGSLKHSHSKTL